MPESLRFACFLIAAILAFVQGVRPLLGDGIKLHFGWLAVAAFAIPFAWDAAELWQA